ncbi:AraC family transcriptional regulator [Glycocaulis profundi]|nr:AraC family transcriptional regulator [Glycocaulis profundi]
MTDLLEAVRRHAETHADSHGAAPTPIQGLRTMRVTAPSPLIHDIARPMVCLVQQGAKRVTTGARTVDFAAGDSLLVMGHVPTVSQVTRASPATPYLSLVMELDPATIAELGGQMETPGAPSGSPVQADPTEAEVTDAALRLMRLIERPAAVSLLSGQLVREMHYWLLAGRHGAAIRALGWPDGHVRKVGRAVALLRERYDRRVPAETLAEAAGMSLASLHRHFRAATSLSPLQFQKQLRLIEAKRLMLSEGASASAAAFQVGYESVPQFTREYGRLFGSPPVRDVEAAKAAARAA